MLFFWASAKILASALLVPMDYEGQKNHLKAYGITYWVLNDGLKVNWLLNYRGGAFLMPDTPEIRKECQIRGVSFEIISDTEKEQLLLEIDSPSQNTASVVLEKAPKIAVYTPHGKQPWDDAVTLVLTYAEIPFDKIFDREILNDALLLYDWVHLHHEDFTGQFGKFYRAYKNSPWYIQNKKEAEQLASELGYAKVSESKLAVANKLKDFIIGGGFLFAMCGATDSIDIALSAEGVDICEPMFDGDASTPNYQQQIDYAKALSFTNFTIERDPNEYEFSDIDTTPKRNIPMERDYFSLREFSAKWDMVPTMLTQNHTQLIKGFMGQTTSFYRDKIKSKVTVLGENKDYDEVKYLHGTAGKGMFTFYGGHDPEDYQHRVGDPPTVLDLHPNSPGYRLILNNVLFPAAKKKKKKT
ncbi:MAG: asparagine synthetase B [Flavobacteriales bacterium]|nr:asparagine synthetase B [Flavobacteriales bacterium]